MLTRLPIQSSHTLLTQQFNISNLAHASAKSGARIGIRHNSKAYKPHSAVFLYHHSTPVRFMAGLLGAFSDAPVSFEAGNANPDNSASSSEIGISPGGSKLKGAYHGLIPSCHSNRQQPPLICLFCSSHTNYQRFQLSGSHETGYPFECCHCRPISNAGS